MKLTDEEIDLIANDGFRNAAGGIYATSVRDFARAVLAAALPDSSDYKRMFEDAVRSLAAIDAELGIDPDEAGGAAPILEAITKLKTLAAQPIDAEPLSVKQAITETIGFDFEEGELQTVNADDLLRLADAFFRREPISSGHALTLWQLARSIGATDWIKTLKRSISALPVSPSKPIDAEPVAWQYENQHGNPFLTHRDPSTWHPHDRNGFKNFRPLYALDKDSK